MSLRFGIMPRKIEVEILEREIARLKQEVSDLSQEVSKLTNFKYGELDKQGERLMIATGYDTRPSANIADIIRDLLDKLGYEIRKIPAINEKIELTKKD
ncbi:MAG: hypothetical protein [Podoviridae sp. ctQNx1]|nr:MAG: hypothetical protein [Podoviridae sp. ctQNx1]UOF78116.1 bone marrow stromal antigen 2 [Caudoviricetes sp.]